LKALSSGKAPNTDTYVPGFRLGTGQIIPFMITSVASQNIRKLTGPAAPLGFNARREVVSWLITDSASPNVGVCGVVPGTDGGVEKQTPTVGSSAYTNKVTTTSWTNAQNLAYKKPTKQSTIGWGGASKRGVDGNKNSTYGGASCTHTDGRTKGPWWRVDLGKSVQPNFVNIIHRSDCCGDRLKGASVYFANTDDIKVAIKGKACGTTLMARNGVNEIIKCATSATAGRYAFVYTTRTTSLTICEFGVHAAAATTTTKSTPVKWVAYKANAECGKSPCGGCNGGWGVNMECHYKGRSSAGHDNVYGYLATYIKSDKAKTVELQTGSDDGHMTYLNGKLVLDKRKACRCYASSQDRKSVQLKAGWNVLTMKVGERGGNFGAVVSFKSTVGLCASIDGKNCYAKKCAKVGVNQAVCGVIPGDDGGVAKQQPQIGQTAYTDKTKAVKWVAYKENQLCGKSECGGCNGGWGVNMECHYKGKSSAAVALGAS